MRTFYGRSGEGGQQARGCYHTRKHDARERSALWRSVTMGARLRFVLLIFEHPVFLSPRAARGLTRSASPALAWPCLWAVRRCLSRPGLLRRRPQRRGGPSPLCQAARPPAATSAAGPQPRRQTAHAACRPVSGRLPCGEAAVARLASRLASSGISPGGSPAVSPAVAILR